ncbi:hypothetical protein D7V82_04080 [bacterium 1xD8-6]|nr:hypothetical protein D7V72_04205 [bacterium D16-36]RKI72208.1 hypothetical protein D7V82_04080 [bacterium 1xD8-6]
MSARDNRELSFRKQPAVNGSKLIGLKIDFRADYFLGLQRWNIKSIISLMFHLFKLYGKDGYIYLKNQMLRGNIR